MSVFRHLDHFTPQKDLEVLDRLAKEAAGKGITKAVEIGSWTGRTAAVLANSFEGVFCIDTFSGNPNDRLGDIAKSVGPQNILRSFCLNAGSDLLRSIFPLVGPSEFWASVWPHKLGFVFIDANHDYESVKLDIDMWSRHMLCGGIICGHDYGVFPGVNEAVDELIPADELNVEGSMWWTYAR